MTFHEQPQRSTTVPPHGGRLVDRTVQGQEAEALRRRAEHLQAIHMTARPSGAWRDTYPDKACRSRADVRMRVSGNAGH